MLTAVGCSGIIKGSLLIKQSPHLLLPGLIVMTLGFAALLAGVRFAYSFWMNNLQHDLPTETRMWEPSTVLLFVDIFIFVLGSTLGVFIVVMGFGILDHVPQDEVAGNAFVFGGLIFISVMMICVWLRTRPRTPAVKVSPMPIEEIP